MSLRLLLACGALLLGLMIIPALLLRRGANRAANRLLALSLALQLPLPLVVALAYGGVYLDRNVTMLMAPAPGLSVVLLIGYIKTMIDPQYRLRPAGLLLLALPFLALLLAAPTGSVDSAAVRLAHGAWPPSAATLIGIAHYLLHTLYLLYAERLLHRHRHRVEHYFSSKAGVDLRGIHWCVRIFLGLMVLGLAFSLLRLIPGMVLWPRLLYSIVVIIASYYVIALLAITQPDIFAGARTDTGEPSPPPPAEPDAPAPPVRPKYETSALSDADAERQWQRLQALLERDKPWLKNDLRLSELAEQAGLPAYQLSQVINQCAGKNFFELINGYRLEQAKRLLADQRDMKIAAIALDSGYNSQTVFYKHFKQATGLTPSNFRRQRLG